MLSVSLANASSLHARYDEPGPVMTVTGPIMIATGETPPRAFRFQVDMDPDTQVELIFTAIDRESGIASMDWPFTVGVHCGRHTEDWVTFRQEPSFRIADPEVAPVQVDRRIQFSIRAAWTAVGCNPTLPSSTRLHFGVNYAIHAQNNAPTPLSSDLRGDFNDSGISPR